MEKDRSDSPPRLKRHLGVGLMALYGVGVMIGAGIYVLVGAVAGEAGPYAPFTFVLAGLIAAISAASFAELSARIPESAGEAAYMREAFGASWLANGVGLAVAAVGIVSAAAVLKGGVGYLLGLVDAPREALEIGIGLLLGAAAAWGVVESLSIAAIFTLVEIVGLLVVSGAGLAGDWALPVQELVPGLGAAPFEAAGIVGALMLAFFAFIGFEDMVNMAEETREPHKTMPRAILLAMAVTAALYAMVSAATVLSVGPERLAASDRPLAMVFEAATGRSPAFIGAIAVAATLNGVLAQIIMAARVLYGLGARSAAFAWARALHPVRRTPTRATALATICVIGLALAAPLAVLAEATSAILLVIFTMVNAALVALKLRGPPPKGAPDLPILSPIFAALSSAGLLIASISLG